MAQNPEPREELLSVGEAARRMGTTVRTLQYYDRQGLLTPSGLSDGGRRRYSSADLVRLHQIQALKYLGFSLAEIKERLWNIDTPAEFIAALDAQAAEVRAQIAQLTASDAAIKQLRAETLISGIVDLSRYAEIITDLRAGVGDGWILRLLPDRMLQKVAEHAPETSQSITSEWHRLCKVAAQLQAAGEPPDGPAGIEFARQWWQMVDRFTEGDQTLIADMAKFAARSEEWDDNWRTAWATTEPYLGRASVALFQQRETESEGKP